MTVRPVTPHVEDRHLHRSAGVGKRCREMLPVRREDHGLHIVFRVRHYPVPAGLPCPVQGSAHTGGIVGQEIDLILGWIGAHYRDVPVFPVGKLAEFTAVIGKEIHLRPVLIKTTGHIQTLVSKHCVRYPVHPGPACLLIDQFLRTGAGIHPVEPERLL